MAALGIACADGAAQTGSFGGGDDGGGEGGECSSQTCNGCCNGGTCIATVSDSECGTGGGLCHDCTQQKLTCQSGACAGPPCNASNCASGCCNPSTGCVTSTTDTECGTRGEQCQDCTKRSLSCNAGACQQGGGGSSGGSGGGSSGGSAGVCPNTPQYQNEYIAMAATSLNFCDKGPCKVGYCCYPAIGPGGLCLQQ